MGGKNPENHAVAVRSSAYQVTNMATIASTPPAAPSDVQIEAITVLSAPRRLIVSSTRAATSMSPIDVNAINNAP